MGDFLAQIAHLLLRAILIALQMKDESIDEITVALHVIRSLGVRAELPKQEQAEILDIVGTGGDSIHSFNISTASMFVIAGAGVGRQNDNWAVVLLVEQVTSYKQ